MEVNRSKRRVERVRALKRFQGLPRRAPHDEPAMEARLSELIPGHWIVGVTADGFFQGGEYSSGLRPVCLIEGVPGRRTQGGRSDQQTGARARAVSEAAGEPIDTIRLIGAIYLDQGLSARDVDYSATQAHRVGAC